MSIHSDSRVTIFLSDFANIDASGKINAIGAGFQLMGVTPQGLTPSIFVTVFIDVPSKYVGHECTVSIDLRDEETGNLVQAPSPTGSLEPLRIQQLCKIDAPSAPGVYLPTTVPARLNLMLGFPNGVLVQPGRTYVWGVEIDGQSMRGWKAGFHVIGPPPAPVFGGFNNPEGVGIPPFTTFHEDPISGEPEDTD